MKWDSVITFTMVVCALITTGLVVHREFFGLSSTRPASMAAQTAVFIKNWKSQLTGGTWLGLPTAPVQLIEFADFECPFCASFHKDLKTLRDRYPSQVALSFVHYPLPGHRFAEPAARVAECAGEQGQFEAMYDLLFEQQNRLGLKPWNEFASEAGVTNLAAFEMCIESTAPVPRIEAGKQLSKKLGIQGTPTLIVNGWKLASPPSEQELDRMVKAILSGKSPVAAQ